MLLPIEQLTEYISMILNDALWKVVMQIKLYSAPFTDFRIIFMSYKS